MRYRGGGWVRLGGGEGGSLVDCGLGWLTGGVGGGTIPPTQGWPAGLSLLSGAPARAERQECQGSTQGSSQGRFQAAVAQW